MMDDDPLPKTGYVALHSVARHGVERSPSSRSALLRVLPFFFLPSLPHSPPMPTTRLLLLRGVAVAVAVAVSIPMPVNQSSQGPTSAQASDAIAQDLDDGGGATA